MSGKHRASWTAERRALQAARMQAINARPEVREKIARACREGSLQRLRGRLEIPAHAHPCVRGLFETMNHQRTTPAEVATRAGFGPGTLRSWRRRHMPLLDVFEAALNALDLELAIVPIGRRGRNGFLRGAAGRAKDASP